MLASATIGWFSGSELYEGVCGPEGDRVTCGMYAAGVLDQASVARAFHNGNPIYCAEGVTLGQLADVFRKWLSDHPADRNVDGSFLVLIAAKKAFPCASEPK